MRETTYTWKVYFLRGEGRRNLVLFPAFAFAGLLGFYLGGITLAILALFLLISSLRDLLFPLRFSLSPEGVEKKGFFISQTLRWDEIKRITKEGKTVRLSPLSTPSYKESFKDILLYLDGNEEEVWQRINLYWRNSS